MIEEEIIEWSKYFYYDETSPSCLRWKVGPTRRCGGATKVKAGDRAGAFSSGTNKRCGSWKVKLNYKIFLAHRIVFELLIRPLVDGEEIDHIDGNSKRNMITNLRAVSRGTNSKNRRMSLHNTSGVTGVFKLAGSTEYGPSWHDVTGVQRTKSFLVHKYGEDAAFKLACEYRAQMIEELNRQNAGYTERHGT